MNLLMPVAGLIKARYRGEKADIDSQFFKLHYRTTATLFFIGCLLVTANDLIGPTINCFGPDGVPGNVLNTYCWIMSTFSVPGSNAASTYHDGAIPGLGPKGPNGEKVVHAYYQWVPFMLFLQGVMFYIPHYLWKAFEQRKMNKITSGLRGKTILESDQRRDACENLINYLWETRGTHNGYAFKYLFCDSLNFINCIGQLFFINKFLGGVFMTYGTEVLSFMNMDDENRTDPMMEVFPRVTKCTFHHYGSSGTIQTKDAACILGLNIINEKIYVTLWFWLLALIAITSVYLIMMVALISVPSLRRSLVTRKATADKKDRAYHLVEKVAIGDWFMIFLISRNMDSMMYNIFIDEITEKYKTMPKA